MGDRFYIDLPFSDPVLIFALVMLIILLAPMVFNKFRIPGIVGLILSGTIVGPSVLGLLERDFTIELLGTVGLLYLMFMAGLAIDLKQFEKLRNKSVAFGILSFLIPQLGAVYVGMNLLDYSLATSLLLGSIVGSHTLLAYPIVERLGITKNIGVTMSMGGTLVTDTLSLGVLAIVAGTVNGQAGVGHWILFAGSVVTFVVGTVLIIPRLGRWFFRNMKYENNTDFVFMVAVLFTTAFLADLAGLAPIIGAFIAGLLMNRLVPESGTLMSRIQFVGGALFIPFFLISVGMLVDVAVLSQIDVWIKAIVFTLLVLAGKGLATWIIRRPYNFTSAEGWVIYGLTTPQSAATLAVTLVAFELGFFDTTAVNAVVIMILLTCLVGPWLVEKYGRQVAIQEEEKPYSAADAPQRILVPLANPETSDALMDIAFMVRDESSDESLYPLTVAPDGANVEANVARGEKMLSNAVIHAASAEVSVIPITRVDLNVAKGIARAVNELRISSVIVGWNGEISTRRRIFGSILDQLLDEIDEMVLVCKISKPVNTFKRLIIAVPPFGSLEVGFQGAVRSLKLMAQQMGVELRVVSTSEREPYVKDRMEAVKPDIDIEFDAIDLWSNVPSWLSEHTMEDDLFVLMSAREGTLSWRPGLDRLPRVISQRYPDLSFITVYPSEAEIEISRIATTEDQLNILNEDRVTLNLDNEAIESVLTEMIRDDAEFRDIEIRRITRRLLVNSTDYTPEVMPGVLLFETHTSKVSEQMLFIGVSPKGLNVEQTANEVYVIFILLSPKDMPPQEHLKALNKVVKLITPGSGLDKIRLAETAKDVIRLMKSG